MIVAGLYNSTPDSRDYNAKDYVRTTSIPDEYMIPSVSPVVDQGSTPYCSPITALTNLEWYHSALSQSNMNFSEEFIYSMKSEVLDKDGMTPRDTMRILHKIGVPTSKDYRKYRNDKSRLLELSSSNRITAYARIYDLDTLKKCLVTYGPIFMALPVYNQGSTFWKGGSLLGGHAVPIVGYTTDSLVIKNSWGTSWGNNGYAELSNEDFHIANEIWTIINV